MLGDVLLATTFESLVIAIASSLILYSTYLYQYDGLRHIPSIHWSASWSRCHALYVKFASSTKSRYYKAHMDHGALGRIRPLVRVGPNEVYTPSHLLSYLQWTLLMMSCFNAWKFACILLACISLGAMLMTFLGIHDELWRREDGLRRWL